jgi:hypothetical protein
MNNRIPKSAYYPGEFGRSGRVVEIVRDRIRLSLMRCLGAGELAGICGSTPIIFVITKRRRIPEISLDSMLPVASFRCFVQSGEGVFGY